MLFFHLNRHSDQPLLRNLEKKYLLLLPNSCPNLLKFFVLMQVTAFHNKDFMQKCMGNKYERGLDSIYSKAKT